MWSYNILSQNNNLNNTTNYVVCTSIILHISKHNCPGIHTWLPCEWSWYSILYFQRGFPLKVCFHWELIAVWGLEFIQVDFLFFFTSSPRLLARALVELRIILFDSYQLAVCASGTDLLFIYLEAFAEPEECTVAGFDWFGCAKTTSCPQPW